MNKDGRGFMYDYLLRQEQEFEKWCNENGLKYVTDKSSEVYKANWKAWHDQRREKEEQKKLEEAEDAKREREINLRNMVTEFERSMPPRYRGARIGDFNMVGELKTIFDGASGLILGENGVGKTHMMWAMMHEWTVRGELCSYVKAQELLFSIKTKENPYKFIRDRFDGVVHVVVDEIDKIFESKADFMYINYLVDRRYEMIKQIVFLGNGDIQNFIAALGQSIFSRLAGDGGVALELCGTDKRTV